MNVLTQIIADKKQEVFDRMQQYTIKELESSRFFDHPMLSLRESILSKPKSAVIAEFKRKSPSAGKLKNNIDILKVVRGYACEGACATSILTDIKYFGGTGDDVKTIAENKSIPILRKEFIISEYQVIESRAMGADAILLISGILTPLEIKALSRLGRSIGLEILLEIHEVKDLEYVNEYVQVIGVNNRNLKTLKTDVKHSEKMLAYLPEACVKISESGIDSAEKAKSLFESGYDGLLVGEMFMKSANPHQAFKEFMYSLHHTTV